MAKDILLASDGDLLIENGDFVIKESELQEVGIILQMSKGELKSDPLIGANLTQFMRAEKNRAKIADHITKQLELDGKDYDTIKEFLTLKI
jgi:hypothetical protein